MLALPAKLAGQCQCSLIGRHSVRHRSSPCGRRHRRGRSRSRCKIARALRRQRQPPAPPAPPLVSFRDSASLWVSGSEVCKGNFNYECTTAARCRKTYSGQGKCAEICPQSCLSLLAAEGNDNCGTSPVSWSDPYYPYKPAQWAQCCQSHTARV